MNLKITQDDFLAGKLKIFQPAQGFRAGSDSVFLPASIKGNKKGKALDLGCGVGTASLCLAFRNPHLQIDGLELHQDMVDIANKNILENNFSKRINVFQSDIFDKKPMPVLSNTYDIVLSNPPYFEQAGTMVDKSRLSARIKQDFSIDEWVNTCLKMLKPRGYIHLIYPTSGLDQVLCSLTDKCGEITVYPLWPKENAESKRCIIVARKGVKTSTKLFRGMVLHDELGGYTEKAQAILKAGKGLFD